MLAFHDKVAEIEERSSERMNFRTRPRIKQVIQRAVALSGVDASVFPMNAAYQAAAPWDDVTVNETMGGGYDGVQGPWLTIVARKA